MTVRGEVEADRLVLDVYAGRVDNMDAAKPEIIKTLFTRGLGYPHGLGQLAGAPILTSPMNVPSWLDNEAIAFLWEDEAGVIQVVSLNTATGRLEFLTHGAEDVINYILAPRGTVVYETRLPLSRTKSDQLLRDGFAVTSPDAFVLLTGDVDGRGIVDHTMCTRRIVQNSRDTPLAAISPVQCQLSFVYTAANVSTEKIFAPDGRRMMINRPVASVPSSWSNYTDSDLASLIAQRERDRSQLESRFLAELGVLDLNMPAKFVGIDVPARAYDKLNIAWAPNGRSFAIWPTFVPADRADAAGLEGRAIAVFGIDGALIAELPMAKDQVVHIADAQMVSSDLIRLTFDDATRLQLRRIGSKWQKQVMARSVTAAESRPASSPIRIEFKEGMNEPTKLYAVNQQTGEERSLLELNPRFGSELSLAHVETVEWEGTSGKHVRGRLYYPLRYEKGKRYPLVIQLGAAPPDAEFSIYGTARRYGIGSGPGWAIHLAQAIAAQDIAVLQTSGVAEVNSQSSELEQIRLRAEGAALAAEHMVRSGIADSKRIGLMGHSIHGRTVEYALTHPSFEFAAAIVSDAADANYLQAALNGWPDSRGDMNGAPPFGAGLKDWLENSPAFNVEHVRCPLQIQVSSSGDGLAAVLSSGWEMFSRLRYLSKPVELYVAPDIRHGSHILQNPHQLLAVQTRALDWWRFWLKDEKRDDQTAVTQYESWSVLHTLRDADTQRVSRDER
jgi:hypothetical protein